MSQIIQNLPSKTIGTRNPNLTYPLRISVRLLILKSSSQILLLHVSSDAYYKLPGGGVELGEAHHDAGRREVMEETGCRIAMDEQPFAMTEEWRSEECGIVQVQRSYCYRATLVEETGHRALTEEEERDDFSHEWVEAEEAVRRLKACRPASEFGRFVKEREIWVLGIFVNGLT